MCIFVTALTCEVPPRLLNGRYHNCDPKQKQKPVYNQICFSICNGGFQLKEPRYLICTENGKLVDEYGRPGRPECVGMHMNLDKSE